MMGKYHAGSTLTSYVRWFYCPLLVKGGHFIYPRGEIPSLDLTHIYREELSELVDIPSHIVLYKGDYFQVST